MLFIWCYSYLPICLVSTPVGPRVQRNTGQPPDWTRPRRRVTGVTRCPSTRDYVWVFSLDWGNLVNPLYTRLVVRCEVRTRHLIVVNRSRLTRDTTPEGLRIPLRRVRHNLCISPDKITHKVCTSDRPSQVFLEITSHTASHIRWSTKPVSVSHRPYQSTFRFDTGYSLGAQSQNIKDLWNTETRNWETPVFWTKTPMKGSPTDCKQTSLRKRSGPLTTRLGDQQTGTTTSLPSPVERQVEI